MPTRPVNATSQSAGCLSDVNENGLAVCKRVMGFTKSWKELTFATTPLVGVSVWPTFRVRLGGSVVRRGVHFVEC